MLDRDVLAQQFQIECERAADVFDGAQPPEHNSSSPSELETAAIRAACRAVTLVPRIRRSILAQTAATRQQENRRVRCSWGEGHDPGVRVFDVDHADSDVVGRLANSATAP